MSFLLQFFINFKRKKKHVMIQGNWNKKKEEFDLASQHYKALSELLDPKAEDEFEESAKNPWKIIIFDKFTQQSLSTLFKVIRV